MIDANIVITRVILIYEYNILGMFFKNTESRFINIFHDDNTIKVLTAKLSKKFRFL
ncbi:hypothetical protein SDC9_166105 [bioreactor metagenome]|uniref:Uncharacterized protein n=1 Tax=bioreactor metagenome TaxID=1076179 RepID=A0A645FYG4_9ZZZZ